MVDSQELRDQRKGNASKNRDYITFKIQNLTFNKTIIFTFNFTFNNLIYVFIKLLNSKC